MRLLDATRVSRLAAITALMLLDEFAAKKLTKETQLTLRQLLSSPSSPHSFSFGSQHGVLQDPGSLAIPVHCRS
jgi:hypothetical protein